MRLIGLIVLSTLLWAPVCFGIAVLVGKFIAAGDREIQERRPR